MVNIKDLALGGPALKKGMENLGNAIKGYATNAVSTASKWTDLDDEKIKSIVSNIIQGGDGKLESYDPSLMTKVATSLDYVNNKAHGSPTDVEYESLPSNLKDDLGAIANTKLNSKGTKSRKSLTEQASSVGVKLRDSELELLEKNPGIQNNYIAIKGASSSIDTKEMTASIQNIITDVENGYIEDKRHLKNRLWSLLNVDNGNSLDYLVDDLRVKLNNDEMSSMEKGKEIKEKFGELYGYEDRTGKEKFNEFFFSSGNRAWQEVANGFSWLMKNGTKQAIINEAQTTISPLAVPLVLRGFDCKDVDEDTAEMVDTTRKCIVGKAIYDSFLKQVYEPIEKNADYIQDTFDKGMGEAFSYKSKDYNKQLENFDTAQGMRGELLGGLSVEIGATELVGGAIGEARGGSAEVSKLLSSDDKWAKFIFKFTKNMAEGKAFSVVNNYGEDMAEDIIAWELLGFGGDFVLDKAGNWLKTTAVKSLVGDKVFDKMLKTAREQGAVSLEKAKKKVVETIFNFIEKKNMKGEEISKYRDEVINLLGGDKTEILNRVKGEFESSEAVEILKEMFGVGEDETAEYYARLRNKLDSVESRGREKVDELWNNLRDMYNNGKKKFSATELEKIRQVTEFVSNRLNKAGETVKNSASAQRWSSWLNPLRDTIETIAQNTVGGDRIHDLNLMISLLSSAKGGVDNKLTEGFWDRFKEKGLSTLFAGGVSALWDYLDDGQLGSPSPYVVALAILGTSAGITSPEALTSFMKTYSKKLSNFEMTALLKEINEGIDKNVVWFGEDFLKNLSSVLTTEAFDYYVKNYWNKNNSDEDSDSRYTKELPELEEFDEREF